MWSGSFTFCGFLTPDNSLNEFGFLIIYGSFSFAGFLFSFDSLAVNGFLFHYGSLSYLGLLIYYYGCAAYRPTKLGRTVIMFVAQVGMDIGFSDRQALQLAPNHPEM